MATRCRPRSRDDFRIAVICASQFEFDAVEAVLEIDWEADSSYDKAENDSNAYRIGSISGHDVVIALLPDRGKVSASRSAAQLSASFRNIRLCLAVGVCGGLPKNPSTGQDIMLGDIIISTGMIQYDYGRQLPNRILRKNTPEDNLSRPPVEIRAFLKLLQTRKIKKLLQEKTFVVSEEMYQSGVFEASQYPGRSNDKLFDGSYRHKHQDPGACDICAMCKADVDPVCQVAPSQTCEALGCSDQYRVTRELPQEPSNEFAKPHIHFGRVASADQTIRSAHHRDQIAEDEGVIAFETLGAGIWESFPAMTIQGVGNYADSHNNKAWNGHAASAAAACMQAVLKEWRSKDQLSQSASEMKGLMHDEDDRVFDRNRKPLMRIDTLPRTVSGWDENRMNELAFLNNAS